MDPKELRALRRKIRRKLKRGSTWVASDHIELMHPEWFAPGGPNVEMDKEQIVRYFGCPICESLAGDQCTTTRDDYMKLIQTKGSWAKLADNYGVAIGGLRPRMHKERYELAAS